MDLDDSPAATFTLRSVDRTRAREHLDKAIGLVGIAERLADIIEELTRERDEARNDLAIAEAEIERINDVHLQQWGEVRAQLRAAETQDGVVQKVDDCVFCQIIFENDPAVVFYRDEHGIGIVPLNPVVDGHVLAIPRRHVADFTDNWIVTADAMRTAFQLARMLNRPCNLITSKGREATQSVFHLHVHIVPRAENDGLVLAQAPGWPQKAGSQ